jgi:hypothetical protein
MTGKAPSPDSRSLTIFRNISGDKFVVFFDPPLEEHELALVQEEDYPSVESLSDEPDTVKAMAFNCATFGTSNLIQGAGILDFFRMREGDLGRRIEGDAIQNLGATTLADWERREPDK